MGGSGEQAKIYMHGDLPAFTLLVIIIIIILRSIATHNDMIQVIETYINFTRQLV